MNFITQLGVLAIILVILVILIKSNQTLEQIYMEGEAAEKTKEVPSFKIPEVNLTGLFNHKSKSKKEDISIEESVDRSSHTIPVEQYSDWYVEMIDSSGRSFGRMGIQECPFTIGRASDNNYVIDDLSVSGHHACVEIESGRWCLADQGSLNKILVGGTPVTRIPMTDRMEVALGNTRLRFVKEGKKSDHAVAYKKMDQVEEWF